MAAARAAATPPGLPGYFQLLVEHAMTGGLVYTTSARTAAADPVAAGDPAPRPGGQDRGQAGRGPGRQEGEADEVLVAAYESGLGLISVAGRFGVRAGDVRAAMRRAGKPLRSPAQARAVKSGERDWEQRYAAGESTTSIARSAGLGTAAVRAWLARRGAAIRGPAAAARARALREGRDPVPRRRHPSLREGTRGRAVLELLAAHQDGLTAPQCAVLAGEQPAQPVLARIGLTLRDGEAAGWVRRAGRTPGSQGHAPAVIWVITAPGRAALAAAARPRRAPAPGRRPRPGPPWAADAASRARAGETAASIARLYHVGPGTVRRALDRQGIPHGRAAPLPGWASDARSRYEQGEPGSSLARRYGVSNGKVRTVLRKQGVAIRDRKQAKHAVSTRPPGAEGGPPR